VTGVLLLHTLVFYALIYPSDSKLLMTKVKMTYKESGVNKYEGSDKLRDIFTYTVELHLSGRWLSGSAWPSGSICREF